MSSDNPTGAGNQQERLDAYIAGYVDGEGSFHVAVQENHRDSSDTTLVLVVRKRRDLLERVIPFFETQPLLSSKHEDFLVFASIVRAMARGEHLSSEGLRTLVERATAMNGGGRYRRVHRDAPRILRDHMPDTAALPRA